MRKIIYLQGLRGTAALGVVLHHFFCAFYPMAVFATGPSHWQWEKLFWSTPLGLLIAGRSLICLFFILSGYVLSLPYFGAGSCATVRGDGQETLSTCRIGRSDNDCISDALERPLLL